MMKVFSIDFSKGEKVRIMDKNFFKEIAVIEGFIDKQTSSVKFLNKDL
jgi:hypothetical protein